MIRSACQKKCAQVCGETQQKNEIEFWKEAPTQTVGAKHQKTNGFSIFFMKSLVIPYQSKIRDARPTLSRFGSLRLCGLARLSGLARLWGLVRRLGLRGCSGEAAFWRQPEIQIWISKKK